MNPAFVPLMYAQGTVAFCVALYATVCWLTDFESRASRLVQRVGTALYMTLFVIACLVGLA